MKEVRKQSKKRRPASRENGRPTVQVAARTKQNAALLHIFMAISFFANMLLLRSTDRQLAVPFIEVQDMPSFSEVVTAEQPETFAALNGTETNITNSINYTRASDSHHGDSNKRRPRIALLSSFVPSLGADTRLKELKHMVNKACYAYLWDYDLIVNQTESFTQQQKDASPWLNFGHWNRVPHLQAIIDDYDWVMYADADHYFRDLSFPLESFLREFKVYNQTPSVFVPTDDINTFHFSSFAVLVKNSPFGKRMLDNWMKFGNGLCRRGNKRVRIQRNGPLYKWQHSDQPGLWFSLVQTYEDFYQTGNMQPICNKKTGFMNSPNAYIDEINEYFKQAGLIYGHHGDALAQMNNQPIVWSTVGGAITSHSWSGLGLQLNTDRKTSFAFRDQAVAVHRKEFEGTDVERELEYCQRAHGCYARYNAEDMLEIGCNDRVFTVAK
eukprot:CAMPEP_0198110602 /NCGR_PEP_ID=MMETSP1442-20131203/2619_1 /TAXON_ID= /ORGANISM="Craspedostauros australis, Strain CCMP3328" /LENGTH=439 /DNA_ID=CAMNT_0043766735 /DNA_START=44 /DNA_END=1363 /DNA_ORIENTATION=-